MSTNAPRRHHLVWPILLIGLGVFLLLRNFGLLPWDVWYLLGRFWPVILILIGLELLLNRTNPLLAAVTAAVVLLVLIAGGVTLAALGYSGLPAAGAATPSAHLSEELNQHQRATVDMQFGAGDLYVSSLPAESANLMEGDFATQGSGQPVSRTFRCKDGDCELRLSGGTERGWSFGNRGADSWQVHLTPSIPLDVRVRSGASRLDLDLSALQVTALRLDVGASSGGIKLPQAAGATAAVVKAGAADLDIAVPAETAARIRARGGLSSFQIDEQRFPRDGDYHVSADYAKATNRIDLDIDSGVASIRVR